MHYLCDDKSLIMASHLVITLETERNGEAVQLHSLSASGLLSFTTVLESLRKLAIAIAGDENVRFSIKSGSAQAIAITDDEVGQSIADTLEQAIEGEISDEELLDPIRKMHREIIRDDLNYGITLQRAGQTINNFKTIFQSKSRIILKPQPGFLVTSEVLRAKVIAVGGKSPNYHLIMEDETEIIINCSESDAMEVNPFLYKRINVLVQKTSYKRENKKDFYSHVAVIQDPVIIIFDQFFSVYNSRTDLMVRLQMLYDVFDQIMTLNERKFEVINLLLSQFDKNDVDINEVKTLLLLSNGFKDATQVQAIISKLEQRYQKTKIKLLNDTTA